MPRCQSLCAVLALSLFGMCPPGDEDAVDLRALYRPPEPEFSVAPITFTDVGVEAGVSAESYGRGSAMVDLDGDGLLDLIAANDLMVNHFYRQLPDHTFVEAKAQWGIQDPERSTTSVLVADFDNDGDNDVYLVNGGFPGQPNVMLRNDIETTGMMTDVSAETGAGNSSIRHFGGTTLDYNNDGLLDIFVTAPAYHNYLLRNDGNLHFTNVSAQAGMVEKGIWRHCSVGDYNNDGWVDIAVGCYNGAVLLYRNNANGTFTDVAVAVGVDCQLKSFGAVLDDFNNDGWQDLYVPKYQFQEDPVAPSELYLNNGDGTFTDVSEGSGMTAQSDMGHNTGDLDADGYPDIFIGTGHPGFLADDVLFLVKPDDEEGLVVHDVSDMSGITAIGPTRCHGIAYGDYNQDGFIDIYTNNGGPPSSEIQLQENFLFRSDGNDNTWTALHLVGVCSNRTAVGARCVAVLDSGREIHRILRVGSGFGNTDNHVLHFGMYPEETVSYIEINWPSGETQTIYDPPMEQITEVIEEVTECIGDVDGNGVVGVDDVVRVVLAWGTSHPDADIDGDGIVGVTDLVTVITNWGPCP